MEGWEDPMNRGTFPWGREDQALQAYYRTLGALRQNRLSLQKGVLQWLHAAGSLLAFARIWQEERTAAVLNTGGTSIYLTLPWPEKQAEDALTGRRFPVEGGMLHLPLPPLSGMLLV